MKKEFGVTGREVMIIVGQWYDDLHDVLKENYDKVYPVSKFLTEPMFGSIEEVKNLLYRGKCNLEKGIRNLEKRDYIEQNFPSLSDAEKKEMENISGKDLFFFTFKLLFTGGSVIYALFSIGKWIAKSIIG